MAALIVAIVMSAGWPEGVPKGTVPDSTADAGAGTDTLAVDGAAAFESLPRTMSHSFKLALPDSWAIVITLDAAPGYRFSELPEGLRQLEGCDIHPDRDLAVPIRISTLNPTEFDDTPQYLLAAWGEDDGHLDLSTSAECFDLVGAAMSSRRSLSAAEERSSVELLVFREFFTPANPEGSKSKWNALDLVFQPGRDWVEEHLGDPDDPTFFRTLLDTTLATATMATANEIPVRHLLELPD